MTRPNPTPRQQLCAEKDEGNRQAALAASMFKKAEIGAILARLQPLGDEHFNASPDAIGRGTSARFR
ncbi:hypothetical protein H5395_18165 [Paracoccus sp. MC1854]|uniref:hypothetical protein n=1 Tax=Paracoccus sp. MC1854 TaxID=2760306 RepID=UPI0016047F9E|nr:hypothetical protein [Paracoccus sp. MC1854]MBB1493360.1 hypothetical protein [Paracoccus sp. MC1854]